MRRFIAKLIGDDFHAKRVMSLADATMGLLHAATLGVHAIGAGLAALYGLAPKHAIKQVDRMLSNAGIEIETFQRLWVAWVVAKRKDLLVTLDWTEFDPDGHATLALNVVTTHGRATPLLWVTIDTKAQPETRPHVERKLLTRLRELLGADTQCTVLADRWFGTVDLYEHTFCEELDFVCRFRGIISVADATGTTKSAHEWLDGKRMVTLENARVTRDRYEVRKVVLVKDPDMDDAWCLATSRGDLTGRQVVDLYGRRFTTEECFRDQKDLRYGMGLIETRIGRPDRRDRLILIAALAQGLLTLLGAASERCGLDRSLRANTVKRRTHSLFRQGRFWYDALPNQPVHRARPLVVNAHRKTRKAEPAGVKAAG